MKDDDYAAVHACVKEAERIRSEALGRLLQSRSDALGRLLRSVWGAILRRVKRYRQRREAMATYDMLRGLDDCMLRDLGFDRSELRSLAAELTAGAERTRVRAVRMRPTSRARDGDTPRQTREFNDGFAGAE